MSANTITLCYNHKEKKEVVFLTHTIDFIFSKENDEIMNKKDIPAIYKNNTLSFIIDEIKYTFLIKCDRLLFQRENKEFKFKLIISKDNKCTYLLKNTQTLLDIKVINGYYTYIDNILNIKYKLETENINNEIQINIKEHK